jgi:hypothetical protein
MPRKRRTPKVRFDGDVPGLSRELVDVLLLGDSPSDPFFIFSVDILEGGQYLRRLWEAHRPELLDEWRRRQGEGLCWAERQYEQRRMPSCR